MVTSVVTHRPGMNRTDHKKSGFTHSPCGANRVCCDVFLLRIVEQAPNYAHHPATDGKTHPLVLTAILPCQDRKRIFFLLMNIVHYTIYHRLH